MSDPTLRTEISAMLKANDNESVSLFESFSKSDELQLRVVAPRKFVLTPLGTKVISFCDLTMAVYTLLKTTKPVHVTVTFAGTNPPSPAVQQILVKDVLMLSAEISAMTIFNPFAGVSPTDDAEVDLTLIGS
jgi:hypothetical protein